MLLLCCVNSNAQVVQSKRHEIIFSGDDNAQYEVSPAGNRGVFLFRKMFTPKADFVELHFLDTALQKRWHGFVKVEQNYLVVNNCFFDSTLYLILHYRNFTRNDLQIIAINCKKGDYVQFSVRNFIPFNATAFHITNKAAIIGGQFNRMPIVLYFNLKSLVVNIVPGSFNEAGELMQVQTYADGSFDVITSARNTMRNRTMWIRNYDDAGNAKRSVMLQPEGNRSLIFGRSVRATEGTQIIAGVYSTGSTEFSKGIFVASIDSLGVQQIRYYDYGDLQNFFRYMRVRQEARVKSRIEKRKAQGKKIRFNYRLLVHELIPYRDHYILLGEAFYPKYTTTNSSIGFLPYYGYSSNMRYPSMNGRLFDGYIYTHAVVIGFDDQGKLLWDNSFEINDVKTFSLEQFVKIDTQSDRIAMLYLFNNEIRSKTIQGSDVVEGKLFDPIKLNSERDLKDKTETTMSKLDYWYDNFFLASGMQNVVSLENGKKTGRKVFFINKVSYK